MEKNLKVRCRGIILHEGKILVVKHGEEFDFYALPGGQIEWAEDLKECMKREIFEELGVVAEVGRLLYCCSFIINKYDHSVEFFFEIKNGKDFLDINKFNGSHKHELFDIIWAGKDDDIKILPEKLQIDFKNGKLLSDEIRFIKDEVML